MQIDGKVALVTGAASGLGLQTCRLLASAGAKIGALDRDPAGLSALRAELGDAVLTSVVDVSDEESVHSAIAAVTDAYGALHVAVSCAGVGDSAKTVSRDKPFPLDKWQRVIGINLTGTFNIIRLAALAMTANLPDPQTGERGVIINTASGAATQGQVGQAAYSASKAGVVGMTLPIARDLAEYAIRVVTISPGLFETPLVAGLPNAVLDALVQKMILYPKRMGRPSEFAMLVRQIVENPYLNATTIDLDGGARMTAR